MYFIAPAVLLAIYSALVKPAESCSDYQLVKECTEPGVFVVKGECIKFSDFVQFDQVRDKNCPPEPITTVLVYALDSVVIDRSLRGIKHALDAVVVIAPKWTTDVNNITASGGGWTIELKNSAFPGKADGVVFAIGTSFSFRDNVTIRADEEDIGEGVGETPSDVTDLNSLGLIYANSGSWGLNKLIERRPTVVSKRKTIFNAIKNYKSYARENLESISDRESLKRFLTMLEEDEDLKDLFYDTFSLIQETLRLEEEFYKYQDKADAVPFYRTQLGRVLRYSEKSQYIRDSLENKKVLSFLYTSILGKIYNIEKQDGDDLIVNINLYIDTVLNNIKRLNESRTNLYKIDKINEYRHEYIKNIDIKIKEAEHYIKTEVIRQIETDSKAIQENIKSLINEVQEKKKDISIEKEQLEEKKFELQKQLVLGVVIGLVSFVGKVAVLLGPVGLAVGTVLQVTSTVADSLLLSKDNKETTITALPKGVAEVQTFREDEISRIATVLNEVQEQAESQSEQPQEFLKKLALYKRTLSDVTDLKEVESVRVQIKMDVKNIGKDKQRYSRSLGSSLLRNKRAPNVARAGEKRNAVIELIPEFFDIYEMIKGEGKENIEAVTEAINEAEEKFKRLEEYENNIRKELLPALQQVEDDLKLVANQLSGKSKPILEVNKWKIQTFLKDVNNQLTQMTQEFNVRFNISRSVTKLEEAMAMLISLYDIIQNYQEGKNVANYLADISSADASNIQIEDPDLRNITNRLEVTISSNLVLYQYRKVFSAFKQYVFPFAHIYLKSTFLPSAFQLDKSLQNSVDKAVNDIDHIKSELDYYRASATDRHSYTKRKTYKSDTKTSSPFYTWKNVAHNDMIVRLLSGEEVETESRVEDSDVKDNAVKFKEIEFQFVSQNETAQKLLNELLDGFEITATHLGYSYYKFNNSIYLIVTNSQRFSYTYEKSKNGPIIESNLNDVIKNGEFMLSPFTVWKLKLTMIFNQTSFEDLMAFKDDVDLQLVGEGIFVPEEAGSTTTPLEVDQYYKRFEI